MVKKIIAAVILFLPLSITIAYDASTTHDLFFQETCKLLNINQNKIDQQYCKIMSQGSWLEDEGGRVRNHFYDPVYSKGLYNFDSAKIHSTSSINKYNWNNALWEFDNRNFQLGYQYLGSVVHLIQDMSVPDHTRLDPHIEYHEYGIKIEDGSPFENYAARFNAANTAIPVNESPLDLPSLGDYFDSLATYSNNNFYSKDTIEKPGYHIIATTTLIKKLSDGKNHVFAVAPSGMLLYEIATSTCKGKVCHIRDLTDPDNLILKDYWTRLSQQAVLYSAGVINIFFREAEALKPKIVQAEAEKKEYEQLSNQVMENINTVRRLLMNEMTSSHNNVTIRNDIIIIRELSNLQGSMVVNSLKNRGPVYLIDWKGLSDNLLTSLKELAAKYPNITNQLLKGLVLAKTPNPPIINSPAGDPITVFATTTITFSGTSEASTTISNNLNSITSLVDNSGNWSTTLELPRGTSTINFFASNEAGTSSPTSITVAVQLPRTAPHIYLSEIAPLGTKVSPADEWIEIANLDINNPADLTGTYITIGSTSIPLSGSIPALGYYLVEFVDDNTISNHSAGTVYSSGSSAGIIDDRYGVVKLEFRNNNEVTLIDEINLGNLNYLDRCFENPGSYCGFNFYFDNKGSLQRSQPVRTINDAYYDIEDVRYVDPAPFYSEQDLEGLDRNGEEIFGTPGLPTYEPPPTPV